MACAHRADDTTEVRHRIEKGWKLKLSAASFAVEGCGGGPSLRRKGGVFDFGLEVAWLEDQKRKAPSSCQRRRQKPIKFRLRVSHPPGTRIRKPDGNLKVAATLVVPLLWTFLSFNLLDILLCGWDIFSGHCSTFKVAPQLSMSVFDSFQFDR
jgi:hypothetical protein